MKKLLLISALTLASGTFMATSAQAQIFGIGLGGFGAGGSASSSTSGASGTGGTQGSFGFGAAGNQSGALTQSSGTAAVTMSPVGVGTSTGGHSTTEQYGNGFSLGGAAQGTSSNAGSSYSTNAGGFGGFGGFGLVGGLWP
jgi:hypothetical protein